MKHTEHNLFLHNNFLHVSFRWVSWGNDCVQQFSAAFYFRVASFSAENENLSLHFPQFQFLVWWNIFRTKMCSHRLCDTTLHQMVFQPLGPKSALCESIFHKVSATRGSHDPGISIFIGERSPMFRTVPYKIKILSIEENQSNFFLFPRKRMSCMEN